MNQNPKLGILRCGSDHLAQDNRTTTHSNRGSPSTPKAEQNKSLSVADIQKIVSDRFRDFLTEYFTNGRKYEQISDFIVDYSLRKNIGERYVWSLWKFMKEKLVDKDGRLKFKVIIIRLKDLIL